VWRFEALISSMGLNTWQPIEVLISLRLHAGHGFHPVFLIGVIVAGNPHYLVFFGAQHPQIFVRRETPKDDGAD
jgi:hypothetical protein